MDNNKEVQSPCTGVCVINKTNNLCEGCFRTIDEIRNWRDLENAQKEAIADEASQRAASLLD